MSPQNWILPALILGRDTGIEPPPPPAQPGSLRSGRWQVRITSADRSMQPPPAAPPHPILAAQRRPPAEM